MTSPACADLQVRDARRDVVGDGRTSGRRRRWSLASWTEISSAVPVRVPLRLGTPVTPGERLRRADQLRGRRVGLRRVERTVVGGDQDVLGGGRVEAGLVRPSGRPRRTRRGGSRRRSPPGRRRRWPRRRRTTTRASQPTIARQGWVALQRAARIGTDGQRVGVMRSLLRSESLVGRLQPRDRGPRVRGAGTRTVVVPSTTAPSPRGRGGWRRATTYRPRRRPVPADRVRRRLQLAPFVPARRDVRVLGGRRRADGGLGRRRCSSLRRPHHPVAGQRAPARWRRDVLGRPLPAPYAPPPAGRRCAGCARWATDPMTWRDLGWIADVDHGRVRALAPRGDAAARRSSPGGSGTTRSVR